MKNCLGISIFLFGVIVCVRSQAVKVEFYELSVEKYKSDVDAPFKTTLGKIATDSCNTKYGNSTCGSLNGTMTVIVSDEKQSDKSKTDMMVQVKVTDNANKTYMNQDRLDALIVDNRGKIYEAVKYQITAVGKNRYSIKYDPNNWIIVPVMIVLTLILLGVVIYLYKHKVDHVAEHMDEKVDDSGEHEGAVNNSTTKV